jgi:hypothetical protein
VAQQTLAEVVTAILSDTIDPITGTASSGVGVQARFRMQTRGVPSPEIGKPHVYAFELMKMSETELRALEKAMTFDRAFDEVTFDVQFAIATEQWRRNKAKSKQQEKDAKP